MVTTAGCYLSAAVRAGKWEGGKTSSPASTLDEELTDKVPAGLRHVDIDRMLELSSATGTNGNEPCYGVLDFTGMKAARNHPAEDERARMVQLATRRSS